MMKVTILDKTTGQNHDLDLDPNSNLWVLMGHLEVKTDHSHVDMRFCFNGYMLPPTAATLINHGITDGSVLELMIQSYTGGTYGYVAPPPPVQRQGHGSLPQWVQGQGHMAPVQGRQRGWTAGAGQVIQVYVKTLTGKTITINISQSATVMDLMCSIQDKEGIPLDQQRLTLPGRSLDETPSWALADYGIGFGATIHLTLKLRGS